LIEEHECKGGGGAAPVKRLLCLPEGKLQICGSRDRGETVSGAHDMPPYTSCLHGVPGTGNLWIASKMSFTSNRISLNLSALAAQKACAVAAQISKPLAAGRSCSARTDRYAPKNDNLGVAGLGKMWGGQVLVRDLISRTTTNRADGPTLSQMRDPAFSKNAK
jgi:hypothetical protein